MADKSVDGAVLARRRWSNIPAADAFAADAARTSNPELEIFMIDTVILAQ
jgi:hypothetical protein